MHQMIIDGYNVIRQTAPYHALAERGDLDQARDALIGDVAALATKNTKVTVVFDGTNNPNSVGEPVNQLGVTVIFSAHGRSADSVVEKLSHQMRDRGDSVEVITSDATIQWTVMSGNVMRKSSREFAGELREDFSVWQKDNRDHSMRSSLDDRLSAEAIEALDQLSTNPQRSRRSSPQTPRLPRDEQ
ncbi:MAG: NYN domain-containing protein [Actinomycetia bacterium]|nr:NYN domain-containing protein [Actinomycetes bacterium]